MNLMLGDCLETLKTLPDDSIDSVVTDPPYGLSFMGKKWDYSVPSVEIWREVLRVLKPGGHVLSFGGTRTYHRMVLNIEDAGFEIRDQIMWIYGSGFPKSHNLKDEWKGWGTALKPANEPICLARKPVQGTVAQNVLKHGCGALNIDESRIGISDNDPNHRKPSVPFTGRVFDVADGGSNGRPTENLNPQGRWPANILFDESAAEVLDAQTAGQRASKPSNTGTKFCATGLFPIESEPVRHDDSGGASRFFYVAKTSKRERNFGQGLEVHRYGAGLGQGKNPEAPTIDKNNHPTVKPIKLMQYLIKLITPPQGVVLDPFMGSGSTGCAAMSLGFDFIGCELSPEYFEIAKRRLEAHKEKSA